MAKEKVIVANKANDEKKIINKCSVKDFRNTPIACMRQWFKAFAKSCSVSCKKFSKDRVDDNESKAKTERIRKRVR